MKKAHRLHRLAQIKKKISVIWVICGPLFLSSVFVRVYVFVRGKKLIFLAAKKL